MALVGYFCLKSTEEYVTEGVLEIGHYLILLYRIRPVMMAQLLLDHPVHAGLSISCLSIVTVFLCCIAFDTLLPPGEGITIRRVCFIYL